MSTLRTTAVTLLAITLAMSIAGCTGTTEISAFSRDQEPADRLPVAFSQLPTGIKADSTRLLATIDAVSYFAGQSADNDDICFAIYKSDDVLGTSCATNLPIELAVAELPDAQLVPSPQQPASDSWHSPVENLAIRSK